MTTERAAVTSNPKPNDSNMQRDNNDSSRTIVQIQYEEVSLKSRKLSDEIDNDADIFVQLQRVADLLEVTIE